MKKILIILLVSLCSIGNMAYAGSDFEAFIANKGSAVNVRSKPDGDVVKKIYNSRSNCYVLTLTDARNGWWRIKWILDQGEDTDVTLSGSPTGQYWIHSSVVGTATSNYGNQRWCLRDTPSKKGKAVYWFNKEIIVHPIQVKGGWVKVEYNGKTGWIEIEKLCSNTITNCS